MNRPPLASLVLLASLAGAAEPPRIEALLKPAVYRKVEREREVAVHADLEGERYEIYAAMLVRASPRRTREILTDYRVYARLIPYVDEARFDEKTRRLELRGGIWKYRLSSTLQFTEHSDRWIAFEVVEGHFRGMRGAFHFEPRDERGTLVYMRGDHRQAQWPPAMIVEQGAEIVFGFTAKRMRSYIEDFK
jgi:ribosome-associated toxin RatA of RatAB toxin-antitoxin module